MRPNVVMDRPPAGRVAVGDVLRGHVASLSNVGVGYLQVDVDGASKLYALARNLDVARFNELRVGQPIAFRANARNGVAELID